MGEHWFGDRGFPKREELKKEKKKLTNVFLFSEHQTMMYATLRIERERVNKIYQLASNDDIKHIYYFLKYGIRGKILVSLF